MKQQTLTPEEIKLAAKECSRIMTAIRGVQHVLQQGQNAGTLEGMEPRLETLHAELEDQRLPDLRRHMKWPARAQ